MSLSDFVQKWFLDSLYNQEGYNVVNTFVFAIAFVLAAWIIYDKFLKLKMEKNKSFLDKNFLIALYGWILFGASLRVLRDIGYYKSFWFATPGIFFVIGIPAIVSLMLFLKYRKDSYYKYWGVPGYLFAIINLSKLPLQNIHGLQLVLGFMAAWGIVLFLLRTQISSFLTNWNFTALYTQLFDATATFVGITYFGFRELHVLPTFLISSYGAWVMFPLKLIVVSIVLYYIDRYSDSDNEAKYIKLLIILLGLATGTRDFLGILTV